MSERTPLTPEEAKRLAEEALEKMDPKQVFNKWWAKEEQWARSKTTSK